MSENLTPEVLADLKGMAESLSNDTGEGFHAHVPAGYMRISGKVILSLLTALEEALRQIAERGEALKPFAAIAEAFEDESWAEDDAVVVACCDWVVDDTKLSVFDFRHAAALLASPPSGVEIKEIGGLCDNCSSWTSDLQKNGDDEWICGPCRAEEPAALAPTNNGGGDE